MAAHAAGQSFPALTGRIGTTLDIRERAYFRLLPTVAGFRSADVRISPDSIVFAIQCDGTDTDTMVTLPRRESRLLESYISQFEHLMATIPDDEDSGAHSAEREILESRFASLLARNLVRIRHFAMSDRSSATITTRQDGSIHGRLWYRTPLLLAVNVGDTPFAWQYPDTNLVLVRIDDIATITVRTHGTFGQGAGIGFLTGAGLVMLVFSEFKEGSHNSGNAALLDLNALIQVGYIGGILGAAFGGLYSMLVSRDAPMDMKLVLRDRPDDIVKQCVFPRAVPPEYAVEYGGDDVARKAGTVPPDTSAQWIRNDSSGRALAFLFDYGVHIYRSAGRDAGVSAGAGLAVTIPVLRQHDSITAVSLRPNFGAGKTYAHSGLDACVHIGADMYVALGLTAQMISEDFGTFGYGYKTLIEQSGSLDYLFTSCAVGSLSTRGFFEIRFQAPINPIMVTRGSPFFVTPPIPEVPLRERFFSVMFRWGWTL